MKIELDLSNFAIKPYLKRTTDIDTSKFAKKLKNITSDKLV